MVPLLPPEIMDHIISFVRSPGALFNCASVCHSWLSASRHNLLRAVTLYVGTKKCELFQQIFHDHTTRSWLRSTSYLELSGFLGTRPAMRFGLCAFVPRFAGQLPNLSVLVLSFLTWESQRLLYTALSTFSSVRKLCLSQVGFHTFSAFCRVLVALPALEHLESNVVVCGDETDSPIGGYTSRLQLRHLAIGHGAYISRPLRDFLLMSPTKSSLCAIRELSVFSALTDDFYQSFSAVLTSLEVYWDSEHLIPIIYFH
ncbi:hypothetical protein BD311DRAFT_236355 [Dichomitus squalens]|uniref:F-box domain-containing protein n=1 Tax=Dichomitus squalens TaxID=114155 RepID=A0A4Q9M746_9APHY|nr:hypothetical protein BD311DRAFT_236355 [Dichomitus squalens]